MDLTGIPYPYSFPVLTPPYTRYYPQTDRSLQMARMAGLEPATPALTVRCSTIELHPNMEVRAGLEPASPVLQTGT